MGQKQNEDELEMEIMKEKIKDLDFKIEVKDVFNLEY